MPIAGGSAYCMIAGKMPVSILPPFNRFRIARTVTYELIYPSSICQDDCEYTASVHGFT